jgi:hypothetical protein
MPGRGLSSVWAYVCHSVYTGPSVEAFIALSNFNY